MTSSPPVAASKKQVPPYVPFKTFSNTLTGWETALPARVDRTLFRSFSGAMQSWLIGTLRYFELIDEDGHPTDRLKRLLAAQGHDREKHVADMVKRGYPFVFANNLDLSKATLGQLQDRFKETGLQGDTIRKAMALFMALAKAGGMTISPFLKMPRQRRTVAPGGSSRPKGGPKGNAPPKPPATSIATKTPTQMLIDILDLEEMGDEEQQAVWTLLRYLKKRGS